jgi:hypothetical protein
MNEPASARSPVNKITWAQVGRVTEPGRYMFKFGWLTITAEDLTVWGQYPNAAFTLVRTPTMKEAGDEFRLARLIRQRALERLASVVQSADAA